MLAERTYKIFGENVAFVNISADLADVTFLAVGLGLGFDVVLIVGVSHRFSVGDNSRFGYRACSLKNKNCASLEFAKSTSPFLSVAETNENA